MGVFPSVLPEPIELGLGNMQESAPMSAIPHELDTTSTRKKRNPRGSLNAEVILAEAFRFSREETVEALSMPKLAKRLGVGVTSLYWYFHTKEELLQAMLSQVADDYLSLLPDHEGLAWDEHFRRYFNDMRRIFLTHDVICDFLIMRTHVSMIGSDSSFFMDRLNKEVGILLAAGFEPEIAARAYQAMSVYTSGTVQKVRMAELGGSDPNRKMFAGLDEQTQQAIEINYSALGATQDYWNSTYSTWNDFNFGLNTILDGLRMYLPD